MDLILGLVVGFLAGLAVGFGLNFYWQRRAAAMPPAASPHAGHSDNLLETILGGGPAAAASPAVKTEAERVEELRQNLRLKFLFDEDKVEQAITREREQAPDASLAQLLEAAVYRWERENR